MSAPRLPRERRAVEREARIAARPDGWVWAWERHERAHGCEDYGSPIQCADCPDSPTCPSVQPRGDSSPSDTIDPDAGSVYHAE